MGKPTAEHSNTLSIFWLNKHNRIIPKREGGGISSGVITWTHRWSGNKSSIGYSISTSVKDTTGFGDHIRLFYTHTDRWSGEKSEMDFIVPLTTTPCNYGGVRYWFVCPLYKNEVYCGRRVGVIYSIGKWFGCRHCGRITYASQMRGGILRGSSVSIPDIEEAEKEVKRHYYKGKPTRKYRRVMKMREKLDNDMAMFAARL